MDNTLERQLIKDAFAATGKAAGLHWEINEEKQHHNVDFVLDLDTGAKRLTYFAQVKRRLRPQTLGLVIQQLREYPQPTLLVADYVTPTIADQLRQHGVQFIDTAGNAFLNVPPLLVWIKGEKPNHQDPEPRKATRAFAPTGLKVIFALLCKPEIVDGPYRAIGERAGVAHGTVGWVMPELEDLGFIARLGDKRRLLQPDRLLHQWTDAYIRALRPKLLLARLHAETLAWWQTLDVRKYDLAFAGEPAAAKLTRYLQPGTLTFYGAKVPARLLVDFRLTRDPRGEIEVLERFWKFDADAEIAPIPLVYADLIQKNDARCLEVAQMLYDDFIAGFEPKN